MAEWWANNSWDAAAVPTEAAVVNSWDAEKTTDAWGASNWSTAKADNGAAPEAWANDTGGWSGAAAEATAQDTSASAPPPRWDNGADTGAQEWNKGGDEWNKPPPATDFWNTQQWNKDNNVLSRKEDWQLDEDDYNLFQHRLGSSAGLDFSRYDSVPVDVSGEKSTMIPACKSFEELYSMFKECLVDELIQNVRRCHYTQPTPVQKYAVPVGLVGRDVMCCAQTGSGKTAAYLVPVVGRMMKDFDTPVGARTTPFEGPCCPDSLIIAPTRELAVQIHEEAQKFCHRTQYLTAILYGGSKPKDQLEKIAKGADLLVACPGRLQDFINRGVVSVASVNMLVLDEADRMLDMGFEPQIREIVESHGMPTKENRQTMMFSATFPETCQKMAQDYLYNYIWIGVGIVGGAVDTVDQSLVKVTTKDKYQKLVETIDLFFKEKRNGGSMGKDQPRALVFCNAKDTAKWLDEQLYELKIDTGALHGNLTQQERETNLARFRDGQIDVMIATDVAARGLDIENVALVINYDMPSEIDSYIHRIGRTGRIGNRGEAITFISCDESDLCLENVETLKSLLQVMRDAKCQLPDWLEGLIETTSAAKTGGSWKWGGKDVRGGSGTEAYRGTGGGDAWSDWKKKSDDNADDWNKDSWDQKDSKDAAWEQKDNEWKASW